MKKKTFKFTPEEREDIIVFLENACTPATKRLKKVLEGMRVKCQKVII